MSQTRYAYLFGANGPGEMQLQYAEKDVQRLASALQEPRYGFITKAVLANSRDDVLEGLEEYTGRCEASDLLLVHFSGHAIYKGQLYLLCNKSKGNTWLVGSRFSEYKGGQFTGGHFFEWKLLPMTPPLRQNLADRLFPELYRLFALSPNDPSSSATFVRLLENHPQASAWGENPLLLSLPDSASPPQSQPSPKNGKGDQKTHKPKSRPGEPSPRRDWVGTEMEGEAIHCSFSGPIQLEVAHWLESTVQEVQCPVCGSVSKAKLKDQSVMLTRHSPRKSRPVLNVTCWMEQGSDWELIQKKESII